MINKKGNYGFNQGIYSVTGFGEIRKDKEFLKGIETSIILSNLMKTIKEQNKDFAWIYYVSKDGHSTLYPNIDTFSHPWIKEYFDMPLWKLSLPKNNPSRELFFTPLYYDEAGLGLMVTIGLPVYYKNEFLGTVNIDITLANQSKFLNRINQLNGKYFISNDEKELIASSKLNNINNKKVDKINNYLSPDMLTYQSSKNEVISINYDYAYIKNLKNTPWTLYYTKSKKDVYSNSVVYSLGFLLIILILLNIKKLLNKLYKAHEEVKITSKNLHHANTQISKSISFASILQEVFNYKKEVVDHFFIEHFVLLNQKDTVGGDIVIVEKINEDECLIMDIDCTGHGVPGAFVSMIVKTLQYQLLKEIVNAKEEISTSDILKWFNIEIKNLKVLYLM